MKSVDLLLHAIAIGLIVAALWLSMGRECSSSLDDWVPYEISESVAKIVARNECKRYSGKLIADEIETTAVAYIFVVKGAGVDRYLAVSKKGGRVKEIPR